MQRNSRRYESESEVIQEIKECWNVNVAHVGDPYYAGDCLIDPHGRILAWLRVFDQKGPDDNGALTFDIRRLTQALLFISTSGKNLVLVVRCSDELRYAVWKPGVAAFRPYVPQRQEQLAYEYWDAVIPWHELKPLWNVLPGELAGATPTKPRVSRRPKTRSAPLVKLGSAT